MFSGHTTLQHYNIILYTFNNIPCINTFIGGFYGSTDPRSALLQKKVSMLVGEGVAMETKKTAEKESGNKRKRKNNEDETDVAVEDTSRVRISLSSVYRFD